MKIVIDTETCKEAGYSIAEILYMLALYYNNQINDAIVEKLNRLGYVNIESLQDEPEVFRYKKCYISREGESLIREILFDSNKNNQEGKTAKDNIYLYYLDIAKAIQQEYPTGKKAGTNYLWRDSSTIIAGRLMRLFSKYPEPPKKEDVVQATKIYVQSFNGNYTYMQLLKYFISKKVLKDGQYEDSSQLLSYMENAGQENISNQDWTTTLR